MSNLFFYIAIAGYALSAISLIVAIVLFFKYNIRYVIKDLNGTIAQQEISALRKKTVTNQNKRVQIYDQARESGKLHKKKGIGAEKPALDLEEEARTSILQQNKRISKEFVIITDIMFVNTEEII